MMELRCSTCGAPLSLEKGMDQCRCEYCGSMNLINLGEKKVEDRFERETAENGSAVARESAESGSAAAKEWFKKADSKVVSIADRQMEESGKKRSRTRASKGGNGFGTSILRMYMVIMIVALLLVSFALNSASVMADEGNDLRSVPQSAKKLEGKEWMDVVQYFRDCGFEEIEAIEEHDLSYDIFHKEGKVDEISISGCTNFDEDATFYKDAKVVISYHSF